METYETIEALTSVDTELARTTIVKIQELQQDLSTAELNVECLREELSRAQNTIDYLEQQISELKYGYK